MVKLGTRYAFLLWLTLFWLTSCGQTIWPDAPPTLKIGLVAPFEGLHRPLGYEALFAVKLALQERNAAGGVAGYRVELVALNDFDDPAEAALQAQALAADPDVLGVVGHLSAAATEAALPLYQQASLAVSLPWSAAGPITGHPGVVGVAATQAETGAYLETFAQAQGLNKVVTENNPQLISNDIQAVMLDTDGVTAGEIAAALRQANFTGRLFGQVEVGSPQLVQVAGPAADDLIFVSPGPDPAHLTNAEAFRQAYQALAGFPPGPRAVLAYDATHILLDGIEQSVRINYQPPTRPQVSAALNKVRRQGVSGQIAFDRQGRRINAPIWLYQIVDQTYPGALFAP